MALFTAEGLTYPEAMELIKNLKRESIEANITAGGVAIYLEYSQVKKAKEICKEAKASFNPGYSSHQERVLIDCGSLDHAAKVQKDARSIIQEWD